MDRRKFDLEKLRASVAATVCILLRHIIETHDLQVSIGLTTRLSEKSEFRMVLLFERQQATSKARDLLLSIIRFGIFGIASLVRSVAAHCRSVRRGRSL